MHSGRVLKLGSSRCAMISNFITAQDLTYIFTVFMMTYVVYILLNILTLVCIVSYNSMTNVLMHFSIVVYMHLLYCVHQDETLINNT